MCVLECKKVVYDVGIFNKSELTFVYVMPLILDLNIGVKSATCTCVNIVLAVDKSGHFPIGQIGSWQV
jgi:hypothetical protein